VVKCPLNPNVDTPAWARTDNDIYGYKCEAQDKTVNIFIKKLKSFQRNANFFFFFFFFFFIGTTAPL
jgi:hypothetical protein